MTFTPPRARYSTEILETRLAAAEFQLLAESLQFQPSDQSVLLLAVRLEAIACKMAQLARDIQNSPLSPSDNKQSPEENATYDRLSALKEGVIVLESPTLPHMGLWLSPDDIKRISPDDIENILEAIEDAVIEPIFGLEPDKETEGNDAA